MKILISMDLPVSINQLKWLTLQIEDGRNVIARVPLKQFAFIDPMEMEM